MKRFWALLIAILTIVMLAVGVDALGDDVDLWDGGGGGWDSGGWDNDWDRDWDTGGGFIFFGGSGGDGGGFGLGSVAIAVVIVVVIVVVAKYRPASIHRPTSMGGRRRGMDAPPVSQPSQRAECQVDQVSLDELMKRDPLFSAADIESTVKQWVIGFESAWCAGDMAPWQWQIGDQLLESYRAQLAMMKQNGEVSVSRDLAVLECAVERWEEDGPQEYLDVWLRVKKKTYKVAASDPDRIVAGNPHTIYHIDYRWQLVRGAGMKTLPEDRREVRCENCGAPIPIDAHLTACEYCKTELDPKSYDWVLGKVEKLAQRNL